MYIYTYTIKKNIQTNIWVYYIFERSNRAICNWSLGWNVNLILILYAIGNTTLYTGTNHTTLWFTSISTFLSYLSLSWSHCGSVWVCVCVWCFCLCECVMRSNLYIYMAMRRERETDWAEVKMGITKAPISQACIFFHLKLNLEPEIAAHWFIHTVGEMIEPIYSHIKLMCKTSAKTVFEFISRWNFFKFCIVSFEWEKKKVEQWNSARVSSEKETKTWAVTLFWPKPINRMSRFNINIPNKSIICDKYSLSND